MCRHLDSSRMVGDYQSSGREDFPVRGATFSCHQCKKVMAAELHSGKLARNLKRILGKSTVVDREPLVRLHVSFPSFRRCIVQVEDAMRSNDARGAWMSHAVSTHGADWARLLWITYKPTINCTTLCLHILTQCWDCFESATNFMLKLQ